MIETARANRLDKEETVLLFAIREVESGPLRNEFNKINVQNTSLAVQSDSMALQIQKGEFLYTKYLKGQFSPLPLEPKQEPISFVEFLGQHLLANEGTRKDRKWIMGIQDKIKEINEELENKNADSTTSELGQRKET